MNESRSLQGNPKLARRHFLFDLLGRLAREKPVGLVCGIILVIVLVITLFANLITPYGLNEQNIDRRLEPPSSQHLFGTDQLGRDVLTRILYGGRVSMVVGLSSALLIVVVATAIGTISGFTGGSLDAIVQRFVDSFMSLPPLLVILTVMSFLPRGLLPVIIVLGITGGIRESRLVRSAVIAIRSQMYIQSAKAIGAPTGEILRRHIVPNIMAPLLVIGTINVGAAILAESSLSFLGFGVPLSQPSWGGMLSVAGRRYMYTAPWLAIWPGFALGLVVFCANMLGDALRDLLDPRLRGGLGRYGGIRLTRKKVKTLLEKP